MRTSIAYFAGAGTVVVAIAAGLGGGVLLISQPWSILSIIQQVR